MNTRPDTSLLEVDADRSGEELRVRVAEEAARQEDEIAAYVDDDGIVRQDSNGAAFANAVYEVITDEG